MFADIIRPLTLTLLLLLPLGSNQQVPSNCVIKREQEKCMEMMALHDSSSEFDCPWFWDNLTCWQPAKVGDVIEVNCP
ncbi:Pituitary adenylate cyclase-activating polypeptide type I receptor [Oryzias melastigma]|uniref:Pituitary adenylate cyclase-activating polypeptide type I receptor n=2 Tax=Oryzias melastigma TaxID=30732 RepID=A0A834F0U6_ORYME|nr:Pituitary adenylate cyclase-activating polypeptide type I receptor [Oryzias melastigma]